VLKPVPVLVRSVFAAEFEVTARLVLICFVVLEKWPLAQLQRQRFQLPERHLLADASHQLTSGYQGIAETLAEHPEIAFVVLRYQILKMTNVQATMTNVKDIGHGA